MESGGKKSSAIIIVLLVLLIVVIAGGATAIVMLLNRQEEPVRETPDGLPIGYEQGATVLDAADAQQQAINDMLRGGPGISIDYRADGYSENGVDFDCYIGNSDVNSEDMYIEIFADDEMTDSVYRSQLIRPGYAFRTVSLNRALPVGNNPVTVAFTTVGEEDGQMVITGQTAIMMTFHVISAS